MATLKSHTFDQVGSIPTLATMIKVKKQNQITPTENQKVVFRKVQELVKKGEKVSIAKAIRETKVYGKGMHKHPEKITKSKGWQLLVKRYIGDDLLANVHHGLLNSHVLDHMVFPALNIKKETGKRGNVSEEGEIGEDTQLNPTQEETEAEILTDEEIKEMLESVNCKVRRIVHGTQARHVYFWSPDNKSRKDALDLGYKLKNRYKEPTDPNESGVNKTLESINTLIKMLKESKEKENE